jgi:hypothetical protein
MMKRQWAAEINLLPTAFLLIRRLADKRQALWYHMALISIALRAAPLKSSTIRIIGGITARSVNDGH